jgi:hypothetical protein
MIRMRNLLACAVAYHEKQSGWTLQAGSRRPVPIIQEQQSDFLLSPYFSLPYTSYPVQGICQENFKSFPHRREKVFDIKGFFPASILLIIPRELVFCYDSWYIRRQRQGRETAHYHEESAAWKANSRIPAMIWKS